MLRLFDTKSVVPWILCDAIILLQLAIASSSAVPKIIEGKIPSVQNFVQKIDMDLALRCPQTLGNPHGNFSIPPGTSRDPQEPNLPTLRPTI